MDKTKIRVSFRTHFKCIQNHILHDENKYASEKHATNDFSLTINIVAIKICLSRHFYIRELVHTISGVLMV